MIQTTKQITDIIKSDSQEMTSMMLKSLIKEHRGGEGARTLKLWKRYTLEEADIYHRKPANYEKVDRRAANDFYADIVDTKVGYMGNEVSVVLSRSKYYVGENFVQSAYDKDREFLVKWQVMANAEDANSEILRYAAACGVAYRLLYTTEGGGVRLKNLYPWEVIYIYDQSIDVPQIALRYYILKDVSLGVETEYKDITCVEWYDEKGITYYIDDGDLNFRIDETRGQGGYEPHNFDGIPIIPFENNGLHKGEPEKVIDLIDAYDAIISSTTSEIEQLRMAYMFVKGMGLSIDNNFVKQLEQTGIFPLEEGGEVGFVNKQLFDAPIQNLLKEIRRNIYQFAKSIDMSKDMGGEMRVIGWQIALLNIENSCKVTERKFTFALRQQYALLSDYWRTFKGVDLDIDELEFVFTRNFPRNIKEEAETLQLLLGNVSQQTAFSLMSFIDDPEIEKEKIEMEEDPYRGSENSDDNEIDINTEQGDEIQKLALNGAQVTAAQGIVQAVSDKTLPRDAAIELLTVAFPAIGRSVFQRMIDSAYTFKAASSG